MNWYCHMSEVVEALENDTIEKRLFDTYSAEDVTTEDNGKRYSNNNVEVFKYLYLYRDDFFV